VKFYDFLDKQPAIGKLVIVEGTERVLADRALEVILDRLLTAEVRDLNLSRFSAEALPDVTAIREAIHAMPFLADRRVVVIADTQSLRSSVREQVWDVAQSVPEGNTLVLLDLLSPRAQRPVPFGTLAGRAALRIDTTAGEDTRERFVRETLERLNAKAEARVIEELACSQADLAAVRNDLEKLALSGKRITFRELEREALAIEDPKAYKYASALAEGRIGEALDIAHESFANDPRNAAIPLLSALATECNYLWELARHGGELPSRARWRERFLRPIARRVGERRARIAYERAVRGIEAIVTGRAGNDPEDHRALVDRITVELSALARPRS
jgi:DNA polymerase III delta subunit